MGIEVALQDERGRVLEIVYDSRNLMPRLLERSLALEPFLTQIDWYGNTVFNRLQIPRFLSAWQVVARQAENDEEATLVAEVRTLAKRCEDSVHLYLKFIGD